jgi:uncharacterized protein (TIGR01244 family)
MKIVQLSDTVSVSDQITPQNVAEIAAAGFKVIVNNRPDGEARNQPASADISRAAEAAGLRYYYLPVTGYNFPGEDPELMASLMNNPDEPVLAFCRSGTRCTNLWVATRSSDDIQDAFNHARSLGYDLSMVVRR